jgi:rubrerythrin
MSLTGSQTEANLRRAFGAESQAIARYRYFAQQADIDGQPDTAQMFRSVADGATGHALGHLEYLDTHGAGDPATGLGLGSTEDNLRSAAAAEQNEHSSYEGAARVARDEGFGEIADWFDGLARAAQSQAERLTAAIGADSVPTTLDDHQVSLIVPET